MPKPKKQKEIKGYAVMIDYSKKRGVPFAIYDTKETAEFRKEDWQKVVPVKITLLPKSGKNKRALKKEDEETQYERKDIQSSMVL